MFLIFLGELERVQLDPDECVNAVSRARPCMPRSHKLVIQSEVLHASVGYVIRPMDTFNTFDILNALPIMDPAAPLLPAT